MTQGRNDPGLKRLRAETTRYPSGEKGRKFVILPCHTKGVKMETVATLIGAQHHKARWRISIGVSLHLHTDGDRSHLSFVTMPPPQPWGIEGTLTFCSAKPCQKPHTAGTTSWKKHRRFPLLFVMFSLHCLFCIYIQITQIPGISPSLRGQCKSKNTAHFHGYPPPSPRLGAWLQMISDNQTPVTAVRGF